MRTFAEEKTTVRLDVWLWAARFYKTRSLCATAVDKAQVRLGIGHDSVAVKPARAVKLGDTYTIEAGQTYVVNVLALSEQRRDASIAQTLYQETTDSQLARQALAQLRKMAPEPASQLRGKPGKKDRRDYQKNTQSW